MSKTKTLYSIRNDKVEEKELPHVPCLPREHSLVQFCYSGKRQPETITSQMNQYMCIKNQKEFR